MSDVAAVYHWPPSELEALDWREFLAYRRDLPRVLKVLGQLP
ncbi:GpE family phage tail protein [Polymorphum gilvum]|nr:GpE family phage tail protein [Polymorphum gilvum]